MEPGIHIPHLGLYKTYSYSVSVFFKETKIVTIPQHQLWRSLAGGVGWGGVGEARQDENVCTFYGIECSRTQEGKMRVLHKIVHLCIMCFRTIKRFQ